MALTTVPAVALAGATAVNVGAVAAEDDGVDGELPHALTRQASAMANGASETPGGIFTGGV